MTAPPKISIEMKGLKELEETLRKLRVELKVKTGGIIVRGLKQGAALIAQEAKARVPHVPHGYSPRFALVKQRARPRARGGPGLAYKTFLKKARAPVKVRTVDSRKLTAMLRSKIVNYPIPSDSHLAGGMPSVVIRVSSAGYERLRQSIRFKSPGVLPGWWWWLEFGTSKRAATPFLRPAFAARHKDAAKAASVGIVKEISTFIEKNRKKTQV